MIPAFLTSCPSSLLIYRVVSELSSYSNHSLTRFMRGHSLANIHVVMMNENCVVPGSVELRLEQDICSLIVGNNFVVRQKISQRATLIAVVVSSQRAHSNSRGNARDFSNIWEVSSNFWVVSIPDPQSFAVALYRLFSMIKSIVD